MPLNLSARIHSAAAALAALYRRVTGQPSIDSAEIVRQVADTLVRAMPLPPPAAAVEACVLKLLEDTLAHHEQKAGPVPPMLG